MKKTKADIIRTAARDGYSPPVREYMAEKAVTPEQLTTLLEDALDMCSEEDEAFARVYIKEQSTRAALRSAIKALQAAQVALSNRKEK